MKKYSTLLTALLTMFLIWDYEPGTNDSLQESDSIYGPWVTVITLIRPESGLQYKIAVPSGEEKKFFRVKREIVFDVKPTAK